MSELKEDFNYWDSEHYVIKEVSGSYDYCLASYSEECNLFPRKKYSTHVFNKTKQDDGNYTFVIKRFKTQELFKIHANYPPSYVRKGVVL